MCAIEDLILDFLFSVSTALFHATVAEKCVPSYFNEVRMRVSTAFEFPSAWKLL